MAFLCLMITIIGAGPVGCYTAYLLAKKGKAVQIFEEHSKIGMPVQCTGIVTNSFTKIIKPKKEFIINKVTRARIFTKNKELKVELKKHSPILDRARFDQYLANKAIKAGVKIFLNHKFLDYKNKELIIKDIKKDKIKNIKTDYLVGADGPLSNVAKSVGLFGKRDFWIGVQVRAKIKIEPDVFQVYLGKIIPDFFAWIVPENRDIARVGLAAKRNSNIYLKEFLKSKKIKKKDIVEKQGGLIPIYNPKLKTQKDRVFIVGDAAMQVKATTGGGIVQGLIAAECLSEAILHKKNYQLLWKRRIGKDLYLALKMRHILDKLSHKDYDYLVSLFKKEKTKEILEKYDRDFPSRFLFKLLLREPRFLYFLKYLI